LEEEEEKNGEDQEKVEIFIKKVLKAMITCNMIRKNYASKNKS